MENQINETNQINLQLVKTEGGGLQSSSVEKISVEVLPAPLEQMNKPTSFRRNRCGAEKRRAKKARERNLNGIPSYPQALLPPIEESSWMRYPNYEHSPGFENNIFPSGSRSNKRPRINESAPHVNIDDPLTKAIVSEDYPDVVLGSEELMLLRNIITKEIDGIQEGPVPRFHDAFLKVGAVVVKCADESSLAWLSECVEKMSPWENVKLKLTNLKTLHKLYKFVVWVPGPPEDSATVLKRLKKQNSGLSTTGWKVYAENVGCSAEGRNLILGVPKLAVRKLRNLNFKLFLGFGQVTFKMHGNQDEEKEYDPC